jgi:hypothetical protein
VSTQQLNSTAACPRETVDRDLHSMCRMLIRPRQAKDSGSRKEGVLGVGLALTLFLFGARARVCVWWRWWWWWWLAVRAGWSRRPQGRK